MIWLKKSFKKYSREWSVEWSSDQDRLAVLMLAVAEQGGPYARLLMATSDSDADTETVFICAPIGYEAFFPGYQLTAPPRGLTASLLLGDQNYFEQYFRFPRIAA